MRRLLVAFVVAFVVVGAFVGAGCDRSVRRVGGGGGGGNGEGDDLGAVGGEDFSSIANDLGPAAAGDLLSSANDLRSGAADLSSSARPDLGDLVDLGATARPDLASSGGPVTGGPCLSGATGATALRVRWANGGGTATPVNEVFGLPDGSRQKVGAYGYQIGFTPSFVDPYLGQGGLQLDGSDFVDLELSTVGLSAIRSATLALYGRSFNTTTSGSFSWQTFEGTGATATSSFPNSAPYTWSAGDMTTEISPGDNRVLIRIKAGGASGSLVVHRIELCLDAS
jgi:hypothetical protein